MNAPLWVAIPVVILLVLAARADVRTRKIPNALVGPALLLGLAVHLALGGWSNAGNAALGMLVGGGLLLPGWLMGWMGAGDVKLMAAAGAWLGYPVTLFAVLGSFIAGGVFALVAAARRGVLVQSIRGAALLGAWAMTRPGRAATPPPVTTGIRFPFALAVMAGVLFALWQRF